MSARTYVVIAGTVGAGKSSTLQAVSASLDGGVFYPESRDLYLERFYAEPERFGFLNQLSYSLQYLEQAVQISRAPGGVIVQDRSILETHDVFSRLQRELGHIDADEFELLSRIYRSCNELVLPQLLIHLRVDSDVALRRVRDRAAPEEHGVTLGVLEELGEAYARWYARFDLCPKIEIDTTRTGPDAVATQVLRAITEPAASRPGR